MKAERAIYQIKVQGKLNQQWSNWLAGMTIRYDQTGGGMFDSEPMIVPAQSGRVFAA